MFTSGVTHMRAALFRDNFIPCQALVALPGPGRAPSGAVESLPLCLFPPSLPPAVRPSARPGPGGGSSDRAVPHHPVPGRAEPWPRHSRASPHGARHRGPAPPRPALPGTARHGCARIATGSGFGEADTSGAVLPNAAGGTAGPALTAPPGSGSLAALLPGAGPAWRERRERGGSP